MLTKSYHPKRYKECCTCGNEVSLQRTKRLTAERKSTKILKKIKKGIDKRHTMCYTMYVIKRNKSEENKMDIREKAIQTFGFEDARTITICVLFEQGKTDLAEQLFAVLAEKD